MNLTADYGRTAAPVEARLDDRIFYVRDLSALEEIQYYTDMGAIAHRAEKERGPLYLATQVRHRVCDAAGQAVFEGLTIDDIVQQYGSAYLQRLAAVVKQKLHSAADLTVEDAEKE